MEPHPKPALTPGIPASTLLADLAYAISNRQAILFAGAGVSMSVGLPSWQELIEHIGEQLGLDSNLLNAPGVGYQVIAEYYRLRCGSIGPLRNWMDHKWKIAEADLRCSKVHELIIDLDFPIIYTTNYDRNMELAYAARRCDHVKIANARDIAKAREGVTQIIKLHGDFDEDESLVIAETDYFDRLAFDTPLDLKLRADTLGKTVLFIGYSMTDLNIRLLLHRLWQTWRRSGLESSRPKSYVFMAERNLVQEAVLEQWGVLTIGRDPDEAPGEALVNFLLRLRECIGESGPT